MKRSLTTSVMCRARAPPRLPRTGGGGNNNNGNNGGGNNGHNSGSGKSDEKPNDRLRMLKRSFSPSTSVPVELFVDAMKHRWGRVYKSQLGDDGYTMIIKCEEATNGQDLQGLVDIVAVLNRWGLAGQFAFYLKYDPSVPSPAAARDGKISINLNVMTNGARACEFQLGDDTI